MRVGNPEMMTKVVRFHEFGGPEVLRVEERLGTNKREHFVQRHPGFVFGIRTRDLGASASYQATCHKNVSFLFFPTHYQLKHRMEAAEREGIRN